jgi:hypothetical protein
MKYALTGHTKGIGKAIYDVLGPANCKGFSKSQGYDIEDPFYRQQICKQADKCTVFINNAHSGWGQVELLIELLWQWHDKHKLIINIGSQAAHVILPTTHQYLLQYAAEKAALKNVVDNSQDYTCSVEYLAWGYVGTDRILNKYPDLVKYKKVNDCVLEVKTLVQNWNTKDA